MKIGILSRKSSLYSTSRLKEAARQRGHDVRVFDYLRAYMNITSHKPQVMYGTEALHFDAIIPRIGASNTFYGTAVVRQFEMAGVYSANESQAISRSRDKLRCMQLLSRAGIGLPVTAFAHSPKDIDRLIEIAGGAPLIIKLLEGTQGVGVVLADTDKAAESVIAAFRQLDTYILVQEFIAEAGGADIRAFVVDNKVVASMHRQGAQGEFQAARANFGIIVKVLKLALFPHLHRAGMRALPANAHPFGVVTGIAKRRGATRANPFVAALMALFLLGHAYLSVDFC